jgi:hypothetical protein
VKVTRVYSDEKGESHFEDLAIQFENFHGNVIKISKSMKSSDMSFSTFSGALAETWHTAPRKQAIITLSGEVELEVSDGSNRRFGPGHVILLEDTTGKGHTTHSVGSMDREEVWVGLD